nr:metallophosphoesterase family protein [Candidatus Sigynarchaeota archaeon]
MSKTKNSATRMNIVSYITTLAGVAAVLVMIHWILVDWWYGFFLIHPTLTIGIWVFYGILWAYSAYLAIRTVLAIRKKPLGSAALKKTQRVPGLLMLVGVIATIGVLYGPTMGEINTTPHLSFTGDPATSITVTWYSTTPYTGQVLYGTNPSSLISSANETTTTKEHVITLADLIPGTRYYYQVGQFGSTWSFKTASNQTNNVTFATFADVHSIFYEPMIPGITVVNPDFIIAAGDLADFGGWQSDWQRFFQQMSPFATNFSLMTAVGNHDSMTPAGGPNYDRYLSMPTSSSGTERYYYFTYNGVHFICLDLEWGIETYSAAQRSWLEGLLDTIPTTDWLVVYDHCMFYSSGSFGNATGDLSKLYNTAGDAIGTFHDLFVSHDVDLVISGHDHHFEITNADNVVYAIVGTASLRLDSRSPANNTQSIYYETELPGFTEIEILGSTCTISGRLYQNDVPMAPFVYSFAQ